MHILLSGVDDDRSQGTEVGGDVTAGFDRPVPGLCQADNQPVNAAGKVVKVLFNAVENEPLSALIAVHHVVMHKNLHGLSFSNQRIDKDDRRWPSQLQSQERRLSFTARSSQGAPVTSDRRKTARFRHRLSGNFLSGKLKRYPATAAKLLSVELRYSG
jgi:hypothetical protein